MVGTIHFKDGHTEKVLGYGYEPNFYCFTKSGNYMCELDEVPIENSAGHVLWIMHKYTWYKYSHELEDWLIADVDYIGIYKE